MAEATQKIQIDIKELEAMSFLLERGYGFDQYVMLYAARESGQGYSPYDPDRPDYIVRWGNLADNKDVEEKTFKSAEEAARCFITKKIEQNLG